MPPRPKCSPAAAQVLARAETEPWPERLFPPNCTEVEKAEIEAIHHAVNEHWKHARDQRALQMAQAALSAMKRSHGMHGPCRYHSCSECKAAYTLASAALATVAAVLEEK